MEAVRYFVPTRGRVGAQATVRGLPSSLHPSVTIVCPEHEVEQHLADWPNVQVLAQPRDIKTIGEKRAWIMLYAASGVEFAWMLDDDLKFKVCVDQKFKSPSSYPDEFYTYLANVMPELWERSVDPYHAVGIGTSYFAPKGGIKENYHLGFAFGFSRELRKLMRWGRLDVFEDIDYTLQVLRSGYKIAVTYDVTVDQIKPTDDDSPEGVGVAGERTSDSIARDLAKLVAYHPGIVSEKPRRPGAHPAAVTKVLWAKASREGQRKRDENK